MKLFFVRVISLDSYMSTPINGLDVMYSEFRGASINQVPILRLFGSTSTGEKICVHIHGVFPYIYIPFDGTQEANSLMYKIADNIDRAVNISLNQASSNSQHVYKISLVTGIPMYGYHRKNHQFFKIYLYNPLLVRKVTNLLMNESTLGKFFQPHEAHLNFTLQFMIDFNLHGMSNMVLSELKFRGDPSNPNICVNPEDLLPATITKITVCELEGDCLAENIVNREEVASGSIAANPGIATLWEDERQRRRNKGETSQIPHLLEMNRTNIEPTKSHFIYKQILRERLSVLSTEKNIDLMNASVYPAETPDGLSIKSASMIESQTPSSMELSLNDTLLNDLDETIKSSQEVDVTLDQDALHLLELLNELGENAKETICEDSILTQVVKEDDDEKDLDLSMPLETVTTPKKCVMPNDDTCEDGDDDLWNTTMIPQLDGESDELMKNLKIDTYLPYAAKDSKQGYINSVAIKNPPSGILIKKALFIKLLNRNAPGRDMPILDEISVEADFKNVSPKKSVRFKRPLATVFGERKIRTRYKKRKPTRRELKERAARKTEEEVKRLGNRIKKMNRQDQIIMIMRKLHKKENRMIVWLNATGVPKFRVLSKDDVKAPYPLRQIENEKEFSKIKIISDIIVKIANYVDPTLHLKIKYPNHCCYLYDYNAKIIPDVIRIPRKVCQSRNDDDMRTFIKTNINKKEPVRPLEKEEKEKKREQNDDYLCADEYSSQYQQSVESLDEKPAYIFSDKYLTDIKDVSLIENIHVQTKDQLWATAEGLRTQLQEHIRLLQTPLRSLDNNNNVNFYSDEQRFSVLSKIKCLASQEGPTESNTDNNWSDDKEQCVQLNFCERCRHKPEVKNEYGKIEENFYKIENCVNNENHALGNVRKSPRLNSPEYKKRKFERFSQIENNLKLFRELKYISIPNSNVKDWNFNNVERKCKMCMNMAVDSSSSEDNLTHGNSLKTGNITRKRKFGGSNSTAINPESIRRSERIRAKQNLILSLDGAADSCSSEDEKTAVERKMSSRKTPVRKSRRYKALPILVNKSPKVQGNPNESGKSVFCDDKSPGIGELAKTLSFEKEATSIAPKSTQNSVCDINVKRQLFVEDSSVNSTIIEERLVCSHFPTFKGTFISENIPAEASSEASVSSSIFSSDEDCPAIGTNFKILTAAEKYDKETNYLAKEGTSKVLTPHQSQHGSQDIHASSESSSLDLITPGQHNVNRVEDLNKKNTATLGKHSSDISSLEINELASDVLSNSNTSSIISVTTVKKAPSRREVIESLDKYGIARVRQKVPFYSKMEDVSGSIEVGFNVLKVNSTTTLHLTEFETRTDSLNSFRKARLDILSSNLQLNTVGVKNAILSFCNDRECIITPVKKPPTRNMVLKWLSENGAGTDKKVKQMDRRTKIHLPSSPKNEGEEDDCDVTLTLTPCTPTSSQSGCDRNTAKTTETAEPTSPVLGSECKARKKQILNKSLRKPLLLSQESSINHSCQISGINENNSFDKSAQNLQDARAITEHQNVTVLVMELHVSTRGDFKPDPSYDSIKAIFYAILHDVPEPAAKANKCRGVIALANLPVAPGVTNMPILDGIGLDCEITYVDSEEALFDEFLKIIAHWDPDICAGYEIELLSWGYLIERASVVGVNIKPRLGRTKINSLRWKDEDAPNELKITGRIVLDVWRLMRHEISLQSYTFESIMFHVLHKRQPYYSFRDLSFWWDHRSNLYRHRTVKYYMTKVMGILELFDKLDFIGRTSELARLFGIQFFEVLSRGTQFRVESMMLRLAKPLNFIPVSPSVQQRAHMNAPEYIALVLEPESKLYNDPVIVLDFQSLYPSIIIAYNYCFTTCIGKVQSLGKSGPFEFGATQLRVSRRLLRKLVDKDLLNFAPCGVGFVRKQVRDGIMPRMLREILDARLMVKNSMKENKEDKVLQRVLHSRQLGLKLIANVTYGYTAANFSGRMPSVEVGDSVVSKGRETLQRAIEMVDNTPEWGAKVVYGDTDSLFVLVAGQSRDKAFEIGRKIADAVTQANPDPIKLKLEKVYQPCILQTKKRYVGYMYESPDQKEPVYEAKGIETVRRDGCPAVSKMLEKCLRILFETKDVSLVKKYVLKQFHKIFSGRASIQDLTFAKEYRGAAGYRPGACVPALELTRKWTAVDKRNEPRSGERVPYVIINGPPGLPLIRLVRSPRDLLNDSSLRPNALYYITRVIIPPINRCFNLIGADLHTWFNQMPRRVTQYLSSSVSPKKKSTISQYFSTTTCASCGEQTQQGICPKCCNNPQTTVINLMEKMRMWERNHQNMNLVCQSCTSSMDIKCVSLDCPILYRRLQTGRDTQQVTYIRQLLSSSDWLL